MDLTEALAYLDRLVAGSDDAELEEAVNRVQDGLRWRDENAAELTRQLYQVERDAHQLGSELDAALARRD